MSQTIITVSDLITIQRLGSLNPNTVDSGTGFDFAIVGTISPNPTTVAGSYAIGVPAAGATTYRLAAVVDWANILIPIPAAARISKVRMLCNGSMNFQANAAWNVTPPGDTFTGTVIASGDVQVRAPSSIYTQNDSNDMSDGAFDNQGTPTGVATLAATGAEVGAIIDKEWDFAVILPSGLDYITTAELQTSFTNVMIQCRPTSLVGSGASATALVTLSVSAGGVDNITVVLTGSLSTTLWEMIIDWELPFTWTLDTPTDPIEEGDTVQATSPVTDGLDFSQLLTATLNWTDSGGTPHSINIPQILWITFTVHLFRFLVPALTGSPQIVILTVTSTQFSGSVELGKLITILFENATGIYKLVAGKTNDTIYDNDNGGTLDVKIPNPIFKTGYIGG